VAQLEFQGLTGVATIEITGGSQDAPPLTAKDGQRYPVIASVQSGLQRVVANAPEALSRLIEVADRLALVLDEKNRAAIADTLENIRRVTAVAAARSGDIDSLLGDTAVTVRELRGTLAAASQMLDQLRQIVSERGEAREALKSIDAASRQLAKLAEDADHIMQDNRQPLRDFTQRSLNEISQLIVDARTLVAGLTRLTDDIERDPARFLFGGNRREGYQPR
jgi:phospholipid/cholesterol/gamma-HCH transport system substrate-binding protein